MSDVQDFFQAEDAVAARLLPGWILSGRTTVPPGAFGYLAPEGDARGELAESGTVVAPGDFSAAWVLREGEWLLDLSIEGLESRDGLPMDATLTVAVEIQRSLSAVRQFLAGRTWPDRIRSPDVAERISASLKESLGRRLEAEPLESLLPIDADGLRELLRDEGEEVFFERGITVRRVTAFEIHGVELAQLKAREADLKLEEQRVRQRLRFIDLWKRNEMGAQLARRDVDAMERYLSQQGVLKKLDHEGAVADHRRQEEHKSREAEQKLRHLLENRELEHRMEIDARKLEEEVEQTRRMNEVLRREGIEAHLFRLKDEALKGRLYRLLLERDMSPEQIRARSAGLTAEDLGDLGDSIRELIASVRSLVDRAPGVSAGGASEEAQLPSPSSSGRLLLVTDGSVHVVAEGSSAPGESPKTLISLDKGGLGPLRSVRAASSPEGPVLLVGAREGIYVVPTGAPGGDGPSTSARTPGTPEVYRLPSGASSLRGGTNSAVLRGNTIFATHSEVGLVRWTRHLGEAPEVLDPVPGTAPTLRGVQIGPRGLLWYARGADVLAVDPIAPGSPVHHFTGAGEEVCSLALTRQTLFVGTAGGRLLRWGLDSMRGPEAVASLGEKPVYMVRSIRAGEEDCCLVGARSPWVAVYEPSGKRRAVFSAPAPVTWVGACGRHVYGVDHRFHVLYIWEWTASSSPVREVRFSEKVRDIWLDPDPAHVNREGQHAALA